MGLKLFRATEYSSSSLFSHTRPLSGIWPGTLVVVSGVALAIAGNLALWRALAEGTGAGHPFLAVALAVGIAAFHCAVLSLVAWRRLLKWAVFALLVLSAVGSYILLGPLGGAPSPWTAAERLALLGPAAVLALAWLWRQPVRIVSVRRQATGNLMVLAASTALLALVLAGAGHGMLALLGYPPGWACMINPAAPLLRWLGSCATMASP